MSTAARPLPAAIRPLTDFCRLVRDHGFPVATDQTAAFLKAVTLLGPRGIDDIYWAARAILAPAPDRLGEFDALFDRRGHWDPMPDAWEHPEQALNQRQFLAALEACLRALPERTARVFMMREHLGLETPEICKELGITATHCWVMLHRARMALRLCLQENWFGK